MKRIAIVSGSFDPITNGHISVINKACAIFDKVYVVVSNNANKKYLFDAINRMKMVIESGLPANAEATIHEGILVDYMKIIGARYIVRGMRDVTDAGYEMQLSAINKELDSTVETILVCTENHLRVISSSFVRELYSHGKDVSKYVPANVAAKMRAGRGI